MTDRLPFNPDSVKPRDVGGPARRERARYRSFDQARPISVSQATDLIKRVLADRVPSPVHVVGEISNLSDRKHWYLSLKDDQNVLNCVMWASSARRCRFRPERGQQVVAKGRFDYYGPQGRLQLYIDSLEPVGEGALELRFRQLCDELRKLGYFEEQRKRPLPIMPRRIAVITSRTGAAVHDVIRTARSRFPGVELCQIDVRVQGEGAAEEVAAALNAVSADHERWGIDAVILTRGGGSLEDLWAFNERVVADAVLHCAVPVVAAIGHEVDTTVAELVADLRCSTPTQAAVRLTSDVEEQHHQLDQFAHRLRAALRRRAENAAARLAAVARHRFFTRPGEVIDVHRRELETKRLALRTALREVVHAARRRVDGCDRRLSQLAPMARLRAARQTLNAQQRSLQHGLRRLTVDAGRDPPRQGEMLRAAMVRRIDRERSRLDALARQFQAVSPTAILDRGYSVTTDREGRLVRSTGDVSEGQAIRTRVADGEFESEVTAGGEQAKPRPRKSGPRPSRSRNRDDGSQPGLF